MKKNQLKNFASLASESNDNDALYSGDESGLTDTSGVIDTSGIIIKPIGTQILAGEDTVYEHGPISFEVTIGWNSGQINEFPEIVKMEAKYFSSATGTYYSKDSASISNVQWNSGYKITYKLSYVYYIVRDLLMQNGVILGEYKLPERFLHRVYETINDEED